MKRLTSIWACVVIISGVRAASAADVLWNVAGQADWNTPGNWNPGHVPTGTDNATFNNNGTATYSTNVTDTFTDIRFGDGSNSGGTVIQSAGTINASSGWLRMNISGPANATYTLSGGSATFARINVNEGGTTGSSTINVQGGTLTVPTSNAGNAQGALLISGGVTLNPGVGTVNVSSGTLSVGGDTAGDQSIVVGNGGINTAQLNINGGLVTTGTSDMNVGGTSFGAVNQSFGTVNLFTNVNGSGWLAIGRGSSGTYTLSGGSLTTTHANNDVVLGNSGTGATGEFDLNGGTATLGPIFSFGTSTFNFNGGTLRPIANQGSMDQASFMSGLTTANVRNGGAIIDSNGFSVTILQLLNHSNISGDNATDGGLTKKGAGTLTLSSAGSYNGPTTVSGGALLFPIGIGSYQTNGATYTITGAGSTLGTTGSGSLNIAFDTTMNVTSGGMLAPSGALTIGVGFLSSGSTLAIDGAGSAATLAQNANFTLGGSGFIASTGVLTVSNNGTFTVGTGGTSNIVNGTININGGSIDLKTLNYTGGPNVTVNFNSGALSFIGDLHVGVGGFLGQNLALDPSKVLTLPGTTTIDQFKTLTLFGGTLSTGTIISNGTFNFTSGTLDITGAGGLTIGSGGALGSSVVVPSGASLNVANATQILNGASLNVNGGSFSSLTLDNFVSVTSNGSFVGAQQIVNHAGGTIDITGGVFSTPFMQNAGSLVQDGGAISIGAFGLLNNSGSYFYIGQNKAATVNGPSINAGEIQLGGASALLTGSGTLDNTGLLHGDGVIGNAVNNDAGGEIRAEAGKRIKLTGTSGTNAGNINLQGGTAEFSQPLTIANGGQVNGQGNLIVAVGSNTGLGANQSSAFGLSDNGTIQFSGGNTNIYGSVNLPGTYNGGVFTGPGTGKLLIGAGAITVSFYGDVWNNGNLFRTQPGSYAVFFGTVHGASSFSGGGTVDFEGVHQVGNSPAVIGIGGNAIYGVASALDINIGGTTPGNGANNYAQVNVAGSATLGGTLNLLPYNGFVPVSGDKFTVMTYGSSSGTFSSIDGTSPAPGLTYSAVYLPTSLVIMTTTNGDKTWGVDASGNSSLGSNWIGGVAPGGVGDSATFSTIITAPRIVAIDADTTVGTLTFDSPQNYTIAGPHALTLQAAGSGAAAINVSAVHGNGAHTIAAPITLASNLNLVQNSTGTFRISGPLSDAAGKQINVSGTGITAITGALNLGNGAALSVSGTSTLRLAVTGAATVGSGVAATISSGATLELAGTVSGLANGANRANLMNNSTGGPGSAGILVAGTHQQVGGIDGSGTTQVNAASDLTANHIIQSALVIGGTSTNPGLVSIAASDASGNPLGESAANPLRAPELASPIRAANTAADLVAGSIASGSLSGIEDSIGFTEAPAATNGAIAAVPEPDALGLLALGGVILLVVQMARSWSESECRPRF
jgi:hypothetical protein